MKLKRLFALMLCLTLAFQAVGCNSSDSESKKKITSVSYDEGKLFDTTYVHVINVLISDEDWADLKANPLDKTKYKVDVEIDGEKIEEVSFATKGNTSLSSVASDSDSDRYSFKINFGKYNKNQTYYGLDKLNLNNIYADATYMKDYISYFIFREAGVDAPLASYVELKINGESFGLYLALEEVGESYTVRTDNADSEIYKPETSMLGNMDKVGGNKDFNTEDMPEGFDSSNLPNNGQIPGNFDTSNIPNNGQFPGNFNAGNIPNNGQFPGNFDANNMPGGQMNGGQTQDGQNQNGQAAQGGQAQGNFNSGNFPNDGQFPGNFDTSNIPNNGQFPGNFDANNMPGGFGNIFGNSSGADLKYTGDTVENYSDIFDNAETDVTDEDKATVVAALKKLSEGKASEALDVTEVINYFVAHNFVMNYDSYTGSMLHNYYLMETDGKLSVIPWDYNLAFGAFSGMGMSGDGATSLVNCGIDTPLSGASEEDRPLWSFITSNEDYLKQYHESYQKLIDKMNSGVLTDEINRVYEMIHGYVENDKSAFYTVDEFETAVTTLSEFCKLRAESISKQLSGSLSTSTEKQNTADKVDASSININAMGSQGGGKDRGEGDFNFDFNKDFKNNFNFDSKSDSQFPNTDGQFVIEK